jgi:hypothetical protein
VRWGTVGGWGREVDRGGVGGGGLLGGDNTHWGWVRGFVFRFLAYVFPTLASYSVLARAVEQSLAGVGHLQCFGVLGIFVYLPH